MEREEDLWIEGMLWGKEGERGYLGSLGCKGSVGSLERVGGLYELRRA